MDYVLAVNESTPGQGYWILDSVSGRQLVDNVQMLEDVEFFKRECVAPDDGPLRVTKHGSVTIVMGKIANCDYLMFISRKKLQGNIISYVILEAMKFGLCYGG